jgi:energy-coupling factor transporter ATP-binding protein EcfA2
MSSIPSESSLFDQAGQKFDLDRLRVDLEKIGKITSQNWEYLKGILCGLDKNEIAERAYRTKGTVSNALTRGTSLQILSLFPEETKVDWKLLPQWLIDAGYGIGENHRIVVKWEEVCRLMLPNELDANPLISGDGVTLGIEDIVPLDLVERKQRPKPTLDPSPENARQALENQEIPLPYDQFFNEVLTRCRSLNQQGKGIAVIGEPGAGKSTLLSAIAGWIKKQGELAIFISLQNLDISLESYLLEHWLKRAIRQREAPKQIQDDLIKQCNADRVWLLLDGVDEMTQSNQALTDLSNQFQGWVSDARIVLTCRVNVWDANRNALQSKFEVYRSRGFGGEEQSLFIQNFFKKANQVELGNRLGEKLEDAPPRLKNLVESPLWMTLLCRTWKRQQGDLPATKAELYQRFTKTFYDWKDKPYIPEEKRPLLEQALGTVAKKAIEQENFRFSLRETFIRRELDEFDTSFFDIACQLGWINKLGCAIENADEPVYTFLHPTFQEYFAAFAINDWNYFFNPISHKLNERTYRVLESHWKEVFLLWIGRTDIQSERKQELINQLVIFGDKCEDFYGGFHHYQSYYIAASALGDFNDLPILREKIISQVVELAFGHIDFKKRRWKTFPDFITNKARLALRETDVSTVVEIISNLLDKIQENDSSNTTLSKDLMLTKLIRTLFSMDIKSGILSLSTLLLELSPGNQKAIDALRNLLVDSGTWTCYSAALVLSREDLSDLRLQSICSNNLEIAGEIGGKISSIGSTMKSKIESSYQDIRLIDTESLIHRLHESYKNQSLDFFAALKRLGEVGSGNFKIIQVLFPYLCREDNPGLCAEIYLSLEKIITQELFYNTVKYIKNYLFSSDVKCLNYYTFSLVWYCAQNMSYPDFYRAWNSSSFSARDEFS